MGGRAERAAPAGPGSGWDNSDTPSPWVSSTGDPDHAVEQPSPTTRGAAQERISPGGGPPITAEVIVASACRETGS